MLSPHLPWPFPTSRAKPRAPPSHLPQRWLSWPEPLSFVSTLAAGGGTKCPRGLPLNFAPMASSTTLPANLPALPAERFFRASLFFLILTSVGTLVSTGKLDVITCILAPLPMLYKGARLWRAQPAELSPSTATWLVIAYLAFFPLDIFFVSRAFVASSSNPALLAALLAAVHFLVFVMLVRLYSATTDRDALFLAMLAFAAMLASCILTVDTSFLILFFIFLLFG